MYVILNVLFSIMIPFLHVSVYLCSSLWPSQSNQARETVLHQFAISFILSKRKGITTKLFEKHDIKSKLNMTGIKRSTRISGVYMESSNFIRLLRTSLGFLVIFFCNLEVENRLYMPRPWALWKQKKCYCPEKKVISINEPKRGYTKHRSSRYSFNDKTQR